jgi:hypothetical protein
MQRHSVFMLRIVKDMPRFDMPLLLGSVHTLQRTAAAVAHRGRTYLLTTASGVAYSSEVSSQEAAATQRE